MGYSSRKPARKPALTVPQIEKRLSWAQDKKDWTIGQWRKVIWSDESRYRVVGNNHGLRVIRLAGERYKPKNIVPVKKFGKDPVMI